MRAGVVALALLLMTAGTVSATDQAWLLGRWEMTRDPDGGPKDWLEFANDGHVTSTKPDGQRVSGRYVASEAAVQMNFKVGTLSVIITLAADSDKKYLYAKSARTGNTAVYEKRP
jgi:hypothetical protein